MKNRISDTVWNLGNFIDNFLFERQVYMKELKLLHESSMKKQDAADHAMNESCKLPF